MELNKGDWKTTAITLTVMLVAGYAVYKSTFGQALVKKLTGTIQDEKASV